MLNFSYERGQGVLSFIICASQVYIRIRDEEWNIYRRYNEFLDMHVTFKKKYPILATFEFPPKKALGNKVYKECSYVLTFFFCSEECFLQLSKM